MKLRIRSSGFVTSKSLTVDEQGVKLAGFSFLSNQRFNFKDIDYILMSDNNELSLQIKQEVFTIPVRPYKDKDAKVVAALLEEVRRAGGLIAS